MTKWITVPQEPTEAMRDAAFEACEISPGTGGFVSGTDARNAIWSAMIAASPKHESEAVGLSLAERMAHLWADAIFGIAWNNLEEVSRQELVAASQCAVDWMNRPLAARVTALAESRSG